jgi:hypothetical protein
MLLLYCTIDYFVELVQKIISCEVAFPPKVIFLFQASYKRRSKKYAKLTREETRKRLGYYYIYTIEYFHDLMKLP